MPQHQFLGTGIRDGQIVEANQVSQSVDAFTGAKDYRITLTGSLELSGSLLMTGSLINEYTGQFSTLGLGVAAPTAPTMLYIKDTSTGGDPAIVVEATTGDDTARLRLKNPDVEYDVGAFGSSGDDFMVVQDASGASRFPFIVGKDTVSYTLYAVDDSVGIGLGNNTKVILTPLDAGSLQAAGRVSGSSMRAGVISASAAGENIHGTASYATYIENAQTASYVKAEDVDFHYSISQQINSGGKIAGVSGSFDALQFNGEPGLAIANQGGNDFSTIISGSADANFGKLFIGDVDGGDYFTFDFNDQYIKAESEFYSKGLLTAQYGLNVSGSGPQGTNSIRVGPDSAFGTVNVPSASLFANDLQFNRNTTAYVSNMNDAGTSKLALSAGGGSANLAFTVSASRDMEAYGQISFTGQNNYQSGLTNLSPYLRLGPKNAYASNFMDNVIYRGGNFSTNSTADSYLWLYDGTDLAGNCEPMRIKVTILGTRDTSSQYRAVAISMDYLVTYVSGNDPSWAIQEVQKFVRQSSYNDSLTVTAAGTKLESYDIGDSKLRLTLDSNTVQVVDYVWQMQIIRLSSAAAS